MRSLIIAEKPSVALKIATALSEAAPFRKNFNGVSYYELQSKGDTLYVVAAVGHLFSLYQKGAEKKLPVFDVEWVPSFKVSKTSYFTKKYLDTIKEVGKNCDSFVNACDYDIEGTVIGTNIIKYVQANDVNKEISGDKVRRMHFSTTTRSDLLASYGKADSFDRNYFDAGETRHVLDWIWGINLSRALMRAISSMGQRKVMSIGRVQGPTLAILAVREKEIKDFKPQDFWKVIATVNGYDFENKRGQIFDEALAKEIAAKARTEPALVEKVDVHESALRPFPPFDLTSLQLEASRALGLDPSKTLAMAQTLYEGSFISYPRTSSQKLPPSLNLPRIITELSKNPAYKELADALIKTSRFRPAEGLKEDEAHPAIYPTGEKPARLAPDEAKLYDLIVKRFLSVFAEWASVEHTSVAVAVGAEKYEAQGSRVTKSGWLSFYNYYKPAENSIPAFVQGAKAKVDKSQHKKLVTKAPDRFSKAGIISLLEKKGLGTKATRAAIIDTLFNRGYIQNKRIEVTSYGMSVYEALKAYCEPILDESMTKKLDDDMEEIISGKTTKAAVIKEGKDIITSIIMTFTKNQGAISESLQKGLQLTKESNVLGKCLKDGGNLVVKYSRAGKQFAACANWPNCNNTYPLPQNAKIVPTGKVCEFCKTPIVKVFRQGKVFEMDLDPSCITKKNWAKPAAGAKIAPPAKAQALATAGPVAVVQAAPAPSKSLAISPSVQKLSTPPAQKATPLAPAPAGVTVHVTVRKPAKARKPAARPKAKPKKGKDEDSK
ncbi:Reverse gyrase [uncultured archaeon]|nr:Reverse gyrase [uncultured archaeon]